MVPTGTEGNMAGYKQVLGDNIKGLFNNFQEPFFFFSLKDLGKLKKNFKKLFLQEQSPVRKLITGLGLDKEWQDGDSMDKSGQVIVFSQRLVSPKQQDGREAQVLSQHSSIRLPQLQFSRRQYCA